MKTLVQHITEKLVINKDYETVQNITKATKLFRVIFTTNDDNFIGKVFVDIIEKAKVVKKNDDEYDVSGFAKLIVTDVKWTYQYNKENNVLYNIGNGERQFELVLADPDNTYDFIELVKKLENGSKDEFNKQQYTFDELLKILNINDYYFPQSIKEFKSKNKYISLLDAGSNRMKKLKKYLNI